MSDLPPGLKDFGDRLTRAAERDVAERRRERRGRRLAHNLGLPVGAAVLAVAVSAGAVRVADRDDEPIEPERGGSGSSLQAAKDPAVVMATATPNPRGGPPWVLRAYTNVDGVACVQVGRLRDGVFGQVQRGAFRRLPASMSGSCGYAAARGPLLAARRASVDLTIVYGLALDRSAVTVQVGHVQRRVRPVGLGAFLALFESADPHARVVVTSKAAGRTIVRRLL